MYNQGSRKLKFEEDIIAPYVSKFSLSAKYKDNENPEIHNISELITIFPGLYKAELKEGRLVKVNDFEAEETSCTIGEIVFEDNEDNKVKTDINLWYRPNKRSLPAIVEFTFNYKVKNRNNIDKLLIEEFPLSLVRNMYNFYHALQERKDIVDMKATTTKTSFVYKP